MRRLRRWYISRVNVTVCFIATAVSPKIAIFTTFLFPWERPWGNHAKCCMDGKRIRCLQIVSLHVPTITVSEIELDIYEKIVILSYPLHSTPSEYRHPLWCGKTRMVSLPNGEKISKICLFVLTWSMNVTDRRTLHDSKDRAYASHRAVKIVKLEGHSVERMYLRQRCFGG